VQISRHKWLNCTHDQLQPYPSSALSFWELQALLHMFASKPALTKDYFQTWLCNHGQTHKMIWSASTHAWMGTIRQSLTLYESWIHIHFSAPRSAVTTIYVCGSSTQISQPFLTTAGEDWEMRNSNVCKRCTHLEFRCRRSRTCEFWELQVMVDASVHNLQRVGFRGSRFCFGTRIHPWLRSWNLYTEHDSSCIVSDR